MITKVWNIRHPNPQGQVTLSNALQIHPLVAQLLINRGITDAQEGHQFLRAETSMLHDPFLLTDMNKAVQRIRQARQNNEKVLIFGDYDVDGVTSSALLYRTLSAMGLDVSYHIPHRVHDGYGLNTGIAAQAKAQGVTLLVAVDCGITAIAEVFSIQSQGIDVIIVDHHEPSAAGLPPAAAVIDPKRHDCSYPFKHLAAIGLVAKLCQALMEKIPLEDLDLVALGTVADVVPLRGENRIFVKKGLSAISQTRKKGLAALLEMAKLTGKPMRPYYIGFILGPRLNASGRMDSALRALELLLCEDSRRARELALELEGFNTARQRLQRMVIEEAVAIIDQEKHEATGEHVIVVHKDGWHKGVLGIAASRIADVYGRPAVVISLQEGVGTASARSVGDFHLHQALSQCSHILENFGGHKLAAGLTILEENIHSFRQHINHFAATVATLQTYRPVLDIDSDLPLDVLSLDLARTLDTLEPFGEGNPVPVFCSRDLTVVSSPAVMGRETLKFWVSDGNRKISAIGFGMAKYRDKVIAGRKVDLAYELAIDDWRKAPTVQLKLKDIQPHT